MSEKTTLIVTATPNTTETDAMQRYTSTVGPMLMAIGGVPVKRVKITDTLAGDKSFAVTIVMDFPSKSALMDLFNSDAYQEMVPFRDKAFSQINIMFAEDLG